MKNFQVALILPFVMCDVTEKECCIDSLKLAEHS